MVKQNGQETESITRFPCCRQMGHIIWKEVKILVMPATCGAEIRTTKSAHPAITQDLILIQILIKGATSSELTLLLGISAGREMQ